MTDIIYLVQDFCMTSSDVVCFFPMRRLLENFRMCSDNSDVRFDNVSVLRLSSTQLIEIYGRPGMGTGQYEAPGPAKTLLSFFGFVTVWSNLGSEI